MKYSQRILQWATVRNMDAFVRCTKRLAYVDFLPGKISINYFEI
jgi:hypothetical protein